jgi:hypothetical protein
MRIRVSADSRDDPEEPRHGSESEANRALMQPEVREKIVAFGLEVRTESPGYFTVVSRRDFENWGKLANDIGFKPR